MSNSSEVRLVGLDFGSTTTSGVVARASIQSAPDRPAELANVAVEYRSSPVFTPFCGEALDEARLAEWLDDWSRAADVVGQDIGGGGAIVTGLAARASNAQFVRRLVQERFGQTLIATADDPGLESWLAFMANCRELSLAEPARPFLNFDIGGGTTNVALGRAGEIRAVGCYQLGARHVRFKPGGYTIVGCSAVGRQLLDDLHIDRRNGDELSPAEVAITVDFIVGSLEALAAGRGGEAFLGERSYLVDLPFMPGTDLDEAPAITFSGGVGELVYRRSLEEDLPGTTAFGDLGIDLARRITQSPLLSRWLTAYRPAALGRATVLGLAIHHTELSGATLFLPDPSLLPLPELPIVGRLTPAASNEEIAAALSLVRRHGSGGCLAIGLADGRHATVRSLADRLAAELTACKFPAERPLVLLVNANVGKALGNYVTRWGRLSVTVLVLDELPDRGAAFVTLGRPKGPVVPVSFYGL